MRGKKRKVAEAKTQEKNIEEPSVADDVLVSNAINSMDEQQKSSDKNTDLKEINCRKFKRKNSDMEEVDRLAKVAETETHGSKDDDFNAKVEGKKDTGQRTNGSSLEELYVLKEKKSFEHLGGSGHKFCEATIILSQLSVDITSNIDMIQLQPDTNEDTTLQPDKNEDTTTAFLSNNEPAPLMHEERERNTCLNSKETLEFERNTCLNSHQVNNHSNKSLTLETEQPVSLKTTKESVVFQINSPSKENATTLEVFTVATKSQVSELNEQLYAKGLLEGPSEFEQSELAIKPYTVQADSKVNEVTNDSAKSCETKETKSMQNNCLSEAFVANKEEVQENPVCVQVISSTPITIVNHTEICPAETYYDHQNVETEKHVDIVTCEAKTKVVDTEENKTENIENERDVTESVASKAVDYEVDQINEINNPDLQDKTAEEIYLQSTDPVNTEINPDCDHHKDADDSETGQIYLEDTEYHHPVPETNATCIDMPREGLVFLSPKTAAVAPEMTIDVSDDLTDSQLCAMDWSSQFPQESGVCQKLPQTSLKPEGARLTTKLTPKSKPEDGTAVVKGLIHELAQLNKSILKTKREMEYARHKRQQNYSLNRR